MSTRDYRDDVIAELATSEAALRDQVEALTERAAFAEADRDAFRCVAVQAIHHAHDLGLELECLTDRYYRALDDARERRVRFLRAADDQQVAA